MWSYFVRRFLLAIPTLLCATFIVFFIVRCAPGGPVQAAKMAMQQGGAMGGAEAGGGGSQTVGGGNVSEAALRTLMEYYKLDKPAVINFAPTDRETTGRALTDDLLDADASLVKDAYERKLDELGLVALPALLEAFERIPGLEAEQSGAEPRPFTAEEKAEKKALLLRALKRVGDRLSIPEGDPRLTGEVDARIAAWKRFWDEEKAGFSDEAVAAAVDRFMREASEENRAAVLSRGRFALPALMGHYEAWFPTHQRQALAARTMAEIIGKDWDLTVDERERENYVRRYQQKLRESEALSDPGHRARTLKKLGSEAQYLARRSEEQFATQRYRWRRYWDRREDSFVDYSGPRQLLRVVTDTGYFGWLANIVRGDFGSSSKYEVPVEQLLRERFPISISLGLIGFFLSYSICIPLGIMKAVKHNSAFDFGTSVLVFIGYSVPGWALGILLLIYTATDNGIAILPLGQLRPNNWEELDFWSKVWQQVRHAILPVTAYMAGSFATLTILTKNSLMENLGQDYVRTAFAKGLPERRVIVVHAMRNSLIPLATGLGHLFSLVLAGSFLIEDVFQIHGMGMLSFKAILNKDQNIVMGFLVIATGLRLFGNIMQDILYSIFDPRIRFQ